MLGEKSSSLQMEDFVLGKPALVCRWRLAGRTLPLENRHLRALSRRTVEERPVSPQLVAWAKQHIEWTLKEGSAEHPDGVLMLIVDEKGQAAMTVGPYKPLHVRTVASLAARAEAASREAVSTGVAPDSLWFVREDRLVWGTSAGEQPSGAATLMLDLAKTMGMPVMRAPGLAERARAGAASFDEVFLVSDEHGIVCSSDAGGPRSRRFSDGYQKLLEKAHNG